MATFESRGRRSLAHAVAGAGEGVRTKATQKHGVTKEAETAPPLDHVCRGRACVYCLVRAGKPIPADVLVPRVSQRLAPDIEHALATIRRLLRDREAS